MVTESLFRPLEGKRSPTVRRIQFEFDGRAIQADEGVSVAAALLAGGVQRFRTSAVSETPRAAYCMMGVCFECLVEIDGVPSRQSCLVQVEEGMKVRSQHGPRALVQESGNE